MHPTQVRRLQRQDSALGHAQRRQEAPVVPGLCESESSGSDHLREEEPADVPAVQLEDGQLRDSRPDRRDCGKAHRDAPRTSPTLLLGRVDSQQTSSSTVGRVSQAGYTTKAQWCGGCALEHDVAICQCCQSADSLSSFTLKRTPT